jgi:hypothetical protein
MLWLCRPLACQGQKAYVLFSSHEAYLVAPDRNIMSSTGPYTDGLIDATGRFCVRLATSRPSGPTTGAFLWKLTKIFVIKGHELHIQQEVSSIIHVNHARGRCLLEGGAGKWKSRLDGGPSEEGVVQGMRPVRARIGYSGHRVRSGVGGLGAPKDWQAA